jgi:membrane associated rhomboid family serine protease
MFPLKDTNHSFSTPFVTYVIILFNILIYAFQLGLTERDLLMFVYDFGLIPDRLFNSETNILVRIFPFFSSMFMHGGLWHLAGNMYFLYIFGDNVEDTFGHLKFLVLYIGFGIFAGLSQSIIFSNSEIPMIGASGALAGVMGVYLVLFPRAKIKTLIFVFLIFIIDIPAIVFLGIWFFIQFLNGTVSGAVGGGTAWWAHIGGFVAGLVYAVYFVSKKKS